MLGKRLAIFLLSFLFVATAFSHPDGWMRYLPLAKEISGVYTFPGDSHGEFKNNLVAVLQDNSCWKVHPKDKSKFSHWKIGDSVQVNVRTSIFWFKREHKFELLNRNLNETVRVMLVKYPSSPLVIINTEVFIAERILKYYKSYDAWGNPIYVPYFEDIYAKRLWLNDGTIWEIKTSFESFHFGNQVYISGNNQSDGLSFFIISEAEREAVYAWATWSSLN